MKNPALVHPHRWILPVALSLILTLCGLGCGGDAVGPRDASAGDAVVPGPDSDVGPDATLPDPNPRLVNGLTVSGVELYQGVQIPVASAGAEITPRNSPLVAERAVLLRVFVEPQAGWTSRNVTAELLVGDSADTATLLTAEQVVSGTSQVADLGSTFNFTIPATLVLTTARFAVRLTSAQDDPVAAGVTHGARYPLDGTLADLGAEPDHGGLDIVLVPIRYEYDGSNRLPDTSPTQLSIIEDLLLALYPISQVTLTVRDVVGWDHPPQWITGNFDFGDLNDYLSDLKVSDGASSKTYYYALVQPDDTFSEYCGGSCTTGQSYVVSSPENGDFRVGGGLGFSGERWAWTLVHELGHMHGQGHAPCDVSGSDTSYPYSGGSIGVWGYDPRSGVIHDPSVFSDVMGYCDDRWVSDYNFQNFWDRMIAVNSLPAARLWSEQQQQQSGRTRVRSLRQRPDGLWVWGRERLVRLPATQPGTTTTVEIQSPTGTVLERRNVPVVRDCRGGRTLLIPMPLASPEAVVVLPQGAGTPSFTPRSFCARGALRGSPLPR